jgi:uncharacterized membrane protein
MGGIATLVGYIMELVALKRLAESLNRHAIWDNALKAVVVAVVGTITLIVLILSPPLWAYVLSTPLHLLVAALLRSLGGSLRSRLLVRITHRKILRRRL